MCLQSTRRLSGSGLPHKDTVVVRAWVVIGRSELPLPTITDDGHPRAQTNYLPLSLAVAIATMSFLVLTALMQIAHSYRVTMHTHIRSSCSPHQPMSSPSFDLSRGPMLLSPEPSRPTHSIHVQMSEGDYATFQQLLGKQGQLSVFHLHLIYRESRP